MWTAVFYPQMAVSVPRSSCGGATLLPMTNRLITGGQPLLRLRTREDLLAAMPYVVGFHPSDSLVAVGLDGPRHRVQFTARVDLPEPGDTDGASAVAGNIAEIVHRQRIGTVVLVAYGSRERAEHVAALTRGRLGDLGVAVREVLRVEGDRFWSLSCADPGCCPPGGRPYDAAAGDIAARATYEGLVALPDREALERSVAPVGGVVRDAMRRATERVEARVETWAAEASGEEPLRRRMLDEGRTLLRDALERYRPANAGERSDREGGCLTADEVALMGMLLLLRRLRDEAWVLIDPARRGAHLALWTDVVRRVDPDYAAAPASLLAFAAWQEGNGALAWVALDRALQAEPDYSMARLIGSALAEGVPPVPWPHMTVEELRSAYDDPDPPPDPPREPRSMRG